MVIVDISRLRRQELKGFYGMGRTGRVATRRNEWTSVGCSVHGVVEGTLLKGSQPRNQGVLTD